MQPYNSKVVTIHALQFLGDAHTHPAIKYDDSKEEHFVETLEGPLTIRCGDWLIRGTEGEFYPCKDSVFTRKYEHA
jgi:hypothetical protein